MRRFGTSKLHLSPPPPTSGLGCKAVVYSLFIVVPIVCGGGESVFRPYFVMQYVVFFLVSQSS